MNEHPRAAGYCRVSTEEQVAHGFSLGEQERTLREDAERRAETWTHTYVEAGQSGRSKEKRPELNAMLAAADRGEFDVLVIPALDRLARNARDAHEIFARLECAGVAIRSLRGEVDTSTATGKLMTGVMASLAEFESNVIGERARSGKAAAARSGRPSGGIAPLGYRYSEDGLVPVPAEVGIIRRIFGEFASGCSQKELARRLNQDAIPTKKPGGEWRQGTIRRVLANPVYVGKIVRYGTLRDATHLPILEQELWDTCQQLLAARGRSPASGRGRPTAGSHLFVRGMLRCRCGDAMLPSTRGATERYKCAARSRDKDACAQPPVSRERVDSAVLTFFEACSLDAEETVATLRRAADTDLEALRELRVAAEASLAKTEASLARIEADYLTAELPVKEYLAFKTRLESDLAGAQADAARLQARERELAEAEPAAGLEETLVALLTDVRAAIVGEVRDADSIAAVRAALLRLFTEFRLTTESPADPGTGAVPVAYPYYIVPVLAEDALARVPLRVNKTPLSR